MEKAIEVEFLCSSPVVVKFMLFRVFFLLIALAMNKNKFTPKMK